MRFEFVVTMVEADGANGDSDQMMLRSDDGYDALISCPKRILTEFVRRNWLKPVRITIEEVNS